MFSELSSKYHHFNICQKNITHSIRANRIGEVHKLVKQNRNLPAMTNKFPTVPVSTSKCQNNNDKTLI